MWKSSISGVSAAVGEEAVGMSATGLLFYARDILESPITPITQSLLTLKRNKPVDKLWFVIQNTSSRSQCPLNMKPKFVLLKLRLRERLKFHCAQKNMPAASRSLMEDLLEVEGLWYD